MLKNKNAGREDVVLRYQLERWCAETPQRVYAVFEDGTSWTYSELLRAVRAAAAGLQKGIRQGDHVLIWLPNGRDSILTWFAINYIGAVCVWMNTAYRGGLLEHVLGNSQARVLVTIGPLIERLALVDRAQLVQVISMGGTAPAIPGLKVSERSVLEQTAEPQALERPIEPWDTQGILYTSGTAGPSKGVLSSYLHLYMMGYCSMSSRSGTPFIDANDRFMVTLPLFHAGGLAPAALMLAIGGSISLVSAFNTKAFWEHVSRTRSTVVLLLGVMTSFLMKQPLVPGEQDTPLRHLICVPLSKDAIDFRERFSVTMHTLFNMSETSMPLISDLNPTQVGVCGKPRIGLEARIVDAFDREVSTGVVGELVVRSETPWTLSHGYNGDAAATARAWRNGWFHTGDAFRRDDEGNYFFVDRLKDSIRCRGENISSFEVENAVSLHPSVREAAAIGVPSEHSEDELLIVVALNPGESLEPAELLEFLRPRLAHFMLPRYVRQLAELPKTPTQKVQKSHLRAQGITPETWDRERAGIRVVRDRFD